MGSPIHVSANGRKRYHGLPLRPAPEEEPMPQLPAATVPRWKTAFLALALGVCLFHAAPLSAGGRDYDARVLCVEGPGKAGPLSALEIWPAGVEGTVFLDSTVVHEGRYSARVERGAG